MDSRYIQGVQSTAVARQSAAISEIAEVLLDGSNKKFYKVHKISKGFAGFLPAVPKCSLTNGR